MATVIINKEVWVIKKIICDYAILTNGSNTIVYKYIGTKEFENVDVKEINPKQQKLF